MRAVCLVPRRSDGGGRRDALWAFVRARWEREHPDVEIFEGTHDGPGPFNRSLAINRAAALAGDWDVAVISDSDSFADATQVRAAIAGAWTGPCEFWLSYDVFNYLTRKMSDRIMAGYDGWWGANNGIEFPMTGTCSSSVIVTRRLWDAVGGFDEGFKGWGFEDVAFSLACQTFGDGVQRIAGPVWHLHHNTSAENNHSSPEWQANRERMLRYGEASYKPDQMRALLDELELLRQAKALEPGMPARQALTSQS